MGLHGAGNHPIHDSNGLLLGSQSRAKGALLPISCDQKTYDANLVALPVDAHGGIPQLRRAEIE